MNETDFKILFEYAQSGDTKAMEELIKMFMPVLCKNSFINGNLDKDCLQELTIKFIKSVQKFKFRETESNFCLI
ncbi:RNA polymerase factor sigma-70 [Filibacter tadaridae]|uniref:RNA polymerase factor sigma-70 n=1 Tax=Filibacter tadaridae TaxID=2483811 RepID=A0A3P5WF52_9BACL|nr:RNA polymerase factor sigma-70 [Filibacter tadaridae]